MQRPGEQQKVEKQPGSKPTAARVHTMPSDKHKPQREGVNTAFKGHTNAPLSLSIARDVLRRIRERDLTKTDSAEKPWGT